MLTVVPGDGSGQEGRKDGSPSLIDEIVREGARRMLAEALRAEVDAYIAAFAAERDENDHRLVVRTGYHQPREVLTSAGAVEVTVPLVNDRRTDPVTGERQRFSSEILPPWARKTPKITEVLPLLYLRAVQRGLRSLAFYDYPVRALGDLRTTNPIESTFATVRHRTKVTKGPGSRAAGLAMAFKLIESAQDRWRAVNAPHLVALVRAGAAFINGKLVERPGEEAQPEAA
jgi:transposase-like protein